MRILLVSYRFPPFNTSGALAVGRLTKGLVSRGHEVVVVTCGNQQIPRTMAMDTRASEVHWVDDPLHLRTPVPAQAKTTSRSGWGWLARFPKPLRPLIRRLRPWYSIPDTQGAWSLAARTAAVRAGSGARSEVVVASSPPHSGLVAGARVARRLGVPLVLNLRDLWMDNPHLHPGKDDSDVRSSRVTRAVESRIERWVIGRASALFTSTPHSGEILRRRYPSSRVFTLMNGIDEFAPVDDPHPNGGPLTVVHTGNLLAGARDPTPLFSALRALKAAGTRVEAQFYGLDDESTLPLATEAHVASLVHVHGPVPHAEARRAQREADVLLILQGDHEGERAVCPGKLFEYLGARRPILSIGPRAGVVDQILTSTGSGVVSTDPDEITGVLAGLAAAKHGPDGLPDLPLEPVRSYDRQAQIDGFDEVLRTLSVVLAR